MFFVKIRLQEFDETTERDQRLLRSNGPDNLSSPTDPHHFLLLGLDRLRQIAVITLLNFKGFEFVLFSNFGEFFNSLLATYKLI